MATTEAAEAVEPVLDAASEAILEGVDGVVETIEVVRNNPVTLAVAGILGLAFGGAAGYFLANKRLKKFYADLASEEISQSKEFYYNLYKTGSNGEEVTPADVLLERHGPEAVAQAVRSYQGREAAEAVVRDEQDEEQLARITERQQRESEEDTESRNVWVDPSFDIEEEMKNRTDTRPFVISHDEYFDSDVEFENVTLTYYEADDTLVDESDNPVRDIDAKVTDEALVRFGHGSKDPNIVYVRNPTLEIDYEVVRSNGSFLKEVLGIDHEGDTSLKHSSDQRKAFRRGEG